MRGKRDAMPGKHVINIGVCPTQDPESAGEPDASWFEEKDFDSSLSEFAWIAVNQIGAFAKLATSMGLVEPEAYEHFDTDNMTPALWMEFTGITADACNKYGGFDYTFGGQLNWKQEFKSKKERAYLNVSLYINKCPQTELPF